MGAARIRSQRLRASLAGDGLGPRLLLGRGRQRVRPRRRPRGPGPARRRDDGRLSQPGPLREGGRRRRSPGRSARVTSSSSRTRSSAPGTWPTRPTGASTARASSTRLPTESSASGASPTCSTAPTSTTSATTARGSTPRRTPTCAACSSSAAFTRTTSAPPRRLMGLAIWDKPASACLSSRIPYGTEVTRERLAQIGGLEAELRRLGLRQVRVRWHALGGAASDRALARVEVARDELARGVRGARRHRRGREAVRLRVHDARPPGLPHGQPQRGPRHGQVAPRRQFIAVPREPVGDGPIVRAHDEPSARDELTVIGHQGPWLDYERAFIGHQARLVDYERRSSARRHLAGPTSAWSWTRKASCWLRLGKRETRRTSPVRQRAHRRRRDCAFIGHDDCPAIAVVAPISARTSAEV